MKEDVELHQGLEPELFSRSKIIDSATVPEGTVCVSITAPHLSRIVSKAAHNHQSVFKMNNGLVRLQLHYGYGAVTVRLRWRLR